MLGVNVVGDEILPPVTTGEHMSGKLGYLIWLVNLKSLVYNITTRPCSNIPDSSLCELGHRIHVYTSQNKFYRIDFSIFF